MLLLPLKRKLIFGVPLGILVGRFWDDPAVWVLLVTVLTSVENNCDTTPRIAETDPAFLADFWHFFFSGELISSTLLDKVLLCCCRSCRENWKKNGSRWIREYYWVGSILKSKWKNVIPDGLSCRISDESFTTFY